MVYRYYMYVEAIAGWQWLLIGVYSAPDAYMFRVDPTVPHPGATMITHEPVRDHPPAHCYGGGT